VLSLLMANVRRRPGRTVLTALGTAVGVATIVALLAVTDGTKQAAGELVNLGRADLGLFQSDAADLTTSILPTSLVPRLERLPAVERATPLQLLIEAVPRHPEAVAFGADPDGFMARRLVMTAGRRARGRREVTVGDQLAADAGWTVGRRIEVHGERYVIAGLHHSGVMVADTGVFLDLRETQRLLEREGETTTIAVEVARDVSLGDAQRQIEDAIPGLTVIDEPSEAARAGANGELITRTATVIVVLALIIGGIVVMNTMLLATIERRGEFAVMSAVGWSPPQIAGLVLAEGTLTAVLGAAIGLLFGIVGSGVLVDALSAGAFVEPSVSAWSIGRGLLVGGAVGVAGGLYPAWRAARLRPAPALAGR
jgi:putative ABC transport system permease protein